jgi:hypothetical protein
MRVRVAAAHHLAAVFEDLHVADPGKRVERAKFLEQEP